MTYLASLEDLTLKVTEDSSVATSSAMVGGKRGREKEKKRKREKRREGLEMLKEVGEELDDNIALLG